MANKEPLEITELPETYVAGLALRTNNKIEQELGDQGWIAKTWEEVRQMEDLNLPAAIYTGYAGDKNDNFSVIIGFQRNAADDFTPGEVISKVLAGKYGCRSRSGIPMNPCVRLPAGALAFIRIITYQWLTIIRALIMPDTRPAFYSVMANQESEVKRLVELWTASRNLPAITFSRLYLTVKIRMSNFRRLNH